jgi:hypothetical protein
MSESNEIAETPEQHEAPLDARAASELLATTRNTAARQLNANTALIPLLGGLVFLIAFGAIWLSVRHQHPYQGPSLGAIGVLYLLVIIVDIVTLVNRRRSSKGIGGRFTRERRVQAAIGLVGLGGSYVVMGALYHAHVSNAIVYGIYPASVPLLVGGVLGAFSAATRDDWILFLSFLLIAATASGAAFAGPVGVWAVSGLGACVVLIGCGLIKLVLQRRTTTPS